MSDPPLRGPSSDGSIARASLFVALLSFLISGTLAVLDIRSRLAGSEIKLVPVQSITLYQDLHDHLVLAAQLTAFNAAGPEFGDLASEITASLQTPRGVAHFPVSHLVQKRFHPGLAPECPQNVRCLMLRNLIVHELELDGWELPGRSARHRHLGFNLSSSACNGPPEACASFRDPESALALFQSKPLLLSITVQPLMDNPRRVLCRLSAPAPTIAYIAANGWGDLRCRE